MKYMSYIWDFDGTLFDSYPRIHAAFERMLERHGIPYTHEKVEELFSDGSPAVAAYYGISEEQMREFFRLDAEDITLRPMAEPYPEAAAILSAIVQAGGENYLCTNRNAQVRTYLRQYGLDKYFAGIVDSTMHFAYKPSPESVEYLAHAFKIDKKSAVMVGDREIDVEAGLGAGMDACLITTHADKDPATAATYRVADLREFAALCEIGGVPSAETVEAFVRRVREEAETAAEELVNTALLRAGQTVVIGCSTSEIAGERIGSEPSLTLACAVFDGLYSVFAAHGIRVAAQCCEHLNRALIAERGAFPGAQEVNVVPMPKAGGSFASVAYRRFADPVALAALEADAGMDIGGTMIGMHLKKVAVPLRLSVKHIGEASLAAARTRAPFVGGERAAYDPTLL